MKFKEWVLTRYFLRLCGNLSIYFLNYFIVGFRVFLKNSVIYPGVRISGAKYLKIDRDVAIREGSYLYIPKGGFIHIGENVFIGIGCVLDGRGGITIGNNVGLGPNVSIFAQMHNHDDTQKPFWEQGFTLKGVRIEDNVSVGARSIILDGVTIGEGSVIGAGSVVTTDIPKFSVAAGAPARILRHRK